MNPVPKMVPLKDPEFRNWISLRPCCICRSAGVLHDDGQYHVTPSHVLTRGAGHGDYFNLVPMCLKHHESFERTVFAERETFRHLAWKFTHEWCEETNPRRWDEIKRYAW